MSRFLEFGIDLGTTNSCIAVIQGTDAVVLPNNDQMNVTPSAVRILKSGSVIVGRRASNAVLSDPENVATEFKRVMGQQFEREFPAANRSMSAEQLSAELLKAMLADAQRLTGKSVRGAVITVPAAFTSLQCEATARAAQMAGLEEFPLLQEPIAAAIAYGAAAEKKGGRWLVFDLGGGTFDVALVSASGENLSVLEHGGDNHLGGKDLDRLIVGELLLPRLRDDYELPDPNIHPTEFAVLHRRLSGIAELAKIELSTAESACVGIFDVGQDLAGVPIECEVIVERTDLEQFAEPLYKRCLLLVDHAVKQAGIRMSDINRILLVGGPTQSPQLRRMLQTHLGLEVDTMLDPMTVVAKGAALYAAALESKLPAQKEAVASNSENSIPVKLAFDAVSNSAETVIAGKVENQLITEVSLDATNGVWTSGWISLDAGAVFEISAPLRANSPNVFILRLRDDGGRELAADCGEIVVRHGIMTISAPPLPHTVSVEVLGVDNDSVLSPVFERMALLPLERDFTFRACRTLRPSEPDTALVIKLWEGESLNDPQANHWIGNMKISSESLVRPIPENSEIQLHLKIDASRLITVEAFVPHLNQHFSDRIYLPKEGEVDYLAQFGKLSDELDRHRYRLSQIEEYLIFHASEIIAEDTDFPLFIFDDDTGDISHEHHFPISPQSEIDALHREIEDIDIAITGAMTTSQVTDDLARGFVERVREVRGLIAALELRLGMTGKSRSLNGLLRIAGGLEDVVVTYGTDIQRERFNALYEELKRSIAREDQRIAERQLEGLKSIRIQVLETQDWFWENQLSHYENHPGFRQDAAAQKIIVAARAALDKGDRLSASNAIRELWGIDRTNYPDTIDPENAKSVRPGLKR